MLEKKVSILSEQVSLCYYGESKEPDLVRLIDVCEENFNNINLNHLYVVQPDLMLFHKNPYIINKDATRYAGKPDLIVEVWSDSNDLNHRNFKKNLYKSSDITEHWYIVQYSNEIECWLGQTQLPHQSLNNILKTQQNIEIDLRYLALD